MQIDRYSNSHWQDGILVILVINIPRDIDLRRQQWTSKRMMWVYKILITFYYPLMQNDVEHNENEIAQDSTEVHEIEAEAKPALHLDILVCRQTSFDENGKDTNVVLILFVHEGE